MDTPDSSQSRLPDGARTTRMVSHFRQVVVWPVYLRRGRGVDAEAEFCELFERGIGDLPWRRVANELEAADTPLEERHYKELVVFLPHVQRFLYGEIRGSATHASETAPGNAARRVYRRTDVTALRVVLRAGQQPRTVAVHHVDLCFFDDVDVALLSAEISAESLPLPVALDLLYRFGRAYPTGWNDKNGQGVHNAFSLELLDAGGRVVAAADAGDREHYLGFAKKHRTPPTAAHWDFLLRPLVHDAADEEGGLRYRQIEYHRMPLMAFLAMDDPLALRQEDWVRLGLVATVHPDEPLPANDPDIAEFNARYCFDRYWAGTEAGPNTRILCSGRALIMVGDGREEYFLDNSRGMLAQFRHQYFILFLIVHFHHAALLVFSDQLVDAIHDLDMKVPESVSNFRDRIRTCFEAFLRFTHRYWFHDISERPHMQALNHMCARHLGNDSLYAEVSEELRDMSQYLDSESARRTNRLFVRLTVVTVFSIVGTVATGFLGMNIFAMADEPAPWRLLVFLLALVGVAGILGGALLLSRRLSELMDNLANERVPLRARLFGGLARRGPRGHGLGGED